MEEEIASNNGVLTQEILEIYFSVDDENVNLDKMHIKKITSGCFRNFKRITKLHLAGNQISVIEGLEHLESLEFLYMSGNKITKIEGLDHLVNLKHLDLSFNRIRVIEGLDTLIGLKTLITKKIPLTGLLLTWKFISPFLLCPKPPPFFIEEWI
jgi:Leucine-rich repeat (LRR) protein